MEMRIRQRNRRNDVNSAVMNRTGRAEGARGAGRRRLAAGVLAAVSGVCLGVGAGAVPAVAVPAAPAVAVKAAVPKGLESFYGQRVEWYDCGATGGMEKSAEATAFKCAKVKVPLDYSQPDGQTIEIAMKKHVATGSIHRGSLFINPGGPGESGVQYVEAAAETSFAGVQGSYDIIGFDPRGVGSSTPITCAAANDAAATPAAGVGAPQADTPPSPVDGGANNDYKEKSPEVDAAASGTSFEDAAPRIAEEYKQVEAQCAANTKPAGLLDHVDTVSAVRDLDILRALSGNEKLDYAGFSYGTYLGAHYAELFPSNTGRMVLDGALDPSISLYERQAGATKGLERALQTYVGWCQAGQGCPLTGGTEAGSQQVRDLIASANQSPLPSSEPNRPVTGTEIRAAVMYSLYGDEQTWGSLTSSLDEAINRHSGSLFRQITEQTVADVVNTAAVRQAITCLDYPVDGDMAVWSARHQEIKHDAPTFGGMTAIVDLGCQAWGHNGTREPAPIHAKGAAPILVVGSTGDPATPYEWARSLADQLDTGRLLTREGNGHVAYGRAAACTQLVDTYLLTGELPSPGRVCRDET
mgnify:FL=1